MISLQIWTSTHASKTIDATLPIPLPLKTSTIWSLKIYSAPSESCFTKSETISKLLLMKNHNYLCPYLNTSSQPNSNNEQSLLQIYINSLLYSLCYYILAVYYVPFNSFFFIRGFRSSMRNRALPLRVFWPLLIKMPLYTELCKNTHIHKYIPVSKYCVIMSLVFWSIRTII